MKTASGRLPDSWLAEIRESRTDYLFLGGYLSFRRLSKVLEVEHIALIRELVVLAVRMRRDMQGAYNREDCPRMEDTWLQKIVSHWKTNRGWLKPSRWPRFQSPCEIRSTG